MQDSCRIEKTYGLPKKKIKISSESNYSPPINNVKQIMPLEISIADYNKANRHFSHKSLQNYFRYLMTQSCVNPMWLSIKRQSNIKKIMYIDIAIDVELFEEMLETKQLKFLSSKIMSSNKALFKFRKVVKKNLWEQILEYQTSDSSFQTYNQIFLEKEIVENQSFYRQYERYILTKQQLKANLYPNQNLPLFKDYFRIAQNINSKKINFQNQIIVIDCEMVTTINGLQLARATFINASGVILFDQYFKPESQIINYNTEFSGITKQILDSVTNTLQNTLYPYLNKIICQKTILIGHSLQNDLNAMRFIYERIIDTSIMFMRKNGTKLKLKALTDMILKVSYLLFREKFKSNRHDSIEDCLATLNLVQSKILRDKKYLKKEYHLLKQMTEKDKVALIVDHFQNHDLLNIPNHLFANVRQCQNSDVIFKLISKYLQQAQMQPNFILTRIQKQDSVQWKQFYLDFDKTFQVFYQTIPEYTAIFINCQSINSEQSCQNESRNSQYRKPFCFILAK